MSDSVEAAIQRAAASASATGFTTPIVIREDRSIVVPTALQQIAVQCDNEANVLHFECPRNWAGIDLAAAALYINVVKPDKSIVAFACTNIVSGEDAVTFDWVITEHITEVAGKLSFLVCARDPSDPGDGYRWHSNLCNSLFVAPGIVCTVPSDTPDPPHIPLYGTDTTLTEPGVPADAAAVGVQLSSLSEKITNLPQADWNQNDKTAADYVKNRPFYTGDPVETVVVEESTTTFAADTDGLYMADFPSTFEATDGETYKISWDGTVYECTCVASHGLPAIGNLSIAGAGSNTGEPFLMIIINGEAIQIVTADTSASHTFSISRKVAPVVKIDKKYLVQPDWNQNDETAADYVKNRTHYEESSYTDYVLNMDGPELVGFSIPEVGGTVTVKINGVESVETVKRGTSGPLGNYTYIGTIDFDSLRKGRTGWCVAAISGGTFGFANPDTTMSVFATVVHKIDDKFINFDGLVRTFDYHFKGCTIYKRLYKNDGSECVLYTCGDLILPEANSKLFGFIGEIGFSDVGSKAENSCFVTGVIISTTDGSITVKNTVFGTNATEMEQLAADYGYTLTTKPNA